MAGSRAGRYLFLRQLTTSYVGSLWEARCEAEQQLLALARVAKVPSDIAADTQQALAESAWDSMELDDDSLVRVADVVFGTGWFALFHDHFEGDTVRTMQRRVQERKSSVPVPVAVRIVLDALEAARKICDASAELGASGRSATVDPGSLLVCDDGRTRLLDGFVGHFVASVPNMSRDSETLAYAAPEQIEGGEIDARTDVFRWAIIAWELLSSKRLLVGTRQAIARRLKSPILRVDRVARVGPAASAKLGEVVAKALQLDPAERYANLGEFADALADAADQVARAEDVIQFTDALVGRESTLARLLMDKPLRLSDAMKSERPTAGVAKSFAQHVRSNALKSPALGAPALPALAPDAMFRALPRMEQPARLSPPAIPARAEAAVAPHGSNPVRPRFKTLIGLSDELSHDLPPGPSLPGTGSNAAATAPAPAPTLPDTSPQSSQHSIADTVVENPLETDGSDDLDDAPTQAYSIRRLTELAAEPAPRARMASGPRLASKPPPAPVAEPATDSKREEATNLETTLPAADNTALIAGVVQSAIAAPAPAAPAVHESEEVTSASAPAEVAPAPKWQNDRRLLAMAMFFAGTTLALALVVVGLVVRSESAEQTAALLANAPAVQLPTPAPATSTQEPAAATPASEPVAAAPVPEPASESHEALEDPDEATPDRARDEEELREADAQAADDKTVDERSETPPPRQAKPKPVKRAKRAAAPAPKRYVPDDI